MLGKINVITNIAVKDLKIARKFYEDVLGLKVLGVEGEEVITFQSGDSMIFVYRSEYAGTNKATTASWQMNDIEGTVQSLKSKNITFEHYQLPCLKIQGDIHLAGDMKVAWFKDPDGNILSLVNGG